MKLEQKSKPYEVYFLFCIVKSWVYHRKKQCVPKNEVFKQILTVCKASIHEKFLK